MDEAIVGLTATYFPVPFETYVSFATSEFFDTGYWTKSPDVVAALYETPESSWDWVTTVSTALKRLPTGV